MAHFLKKIKINTYQNVDVAVEDRVEGQELASAVVGSVNPCDEVVLKNAGPVAARNDGQG